MNKLIMEYLEKIIKIKNIRNFADFSEEKNSNLKMNTVVYAGNGGGKTNLSKFLKYLSDPDLDIEELRSREAKEDNQKIEFMVRIDGRNITADNYKNPEMQKTTRRLQVFNDEFVKTNVACDNFSNKDLDGDVIVANVGEEGIKLEVANQQLKTARDQADTACLNIKSKFQEFIAELEQGGVYTRNDDRNVWKELVISKIVTENGALNKEELDKIKALSGDAGFLTCEADLKAIKGLSDTDKLTISQTLESGDMDLEEIKTILETKHSIDDINKDIKSNFERVKDWLSSELLSEQDAQSILQKAITVSCKDGACALCRKDLDDSSKRVFNWYQTYLDDKRAKFEKHIDNQTEKIKLLKGKVEGLNNDLEVATNRYAKLFGIKKSWTKINNVATVAAIDGLIANLNKKSANPDKAYVYNVGILGLLDELQSAVKANIELCEQINKRMDKNSSRAANLRTLIGKKLLKKFVSDNSKELSDLEKAHSQIDNAAAEIDSLNKLMGENSVIGEVKRLFNKFLHDFIGLKKYSAETEGERIYIKLKSFDISQETQRISEGEKQMIGLCYFLASRIKCLNSAELFRQGIFVIDDPVSSISYSNFFGVTSLIQNFEAAFEESFKESFKEQGKSFMVQKIILTHNIQLFNILQKHVMRKSEKPSRVFYRLQDDGLKGLSSTRLLSDFEMSLYRIIEAAKDDKSTVLSSNVANDMRRVLETIKHFFGYEHLNPETIKKIFPHISGDHVDLYQLINCCSHSTMQTASDPLQEALDSGAKQFIELIKHDKSPFKELYQQIESVSAPKV